MRLFSEAYVIVGWVVESQSLSSLIVTIIIIIIIITSLISPNVKRTSLPLSYTQTISVFDMLRCQ